MAPTSSSSGVDKITVHAKAIVCQDADLRGDITIGSGTVIQPRCTILAVSGPIVIGPNCIVEETAAIVNRRKELMTIGTENLFETGSRVESPSIGDRNVFSVRCRVSPLVRIGSDTFIDAGCVVLPLPSPSTAALISSSTPTPASSAPGTPALSSATPSVPGTPLFGASAGAAQPQMEETLPNRTAVFGSDARRRVWSGEGQGQQRALLAKHLEYLREMLPKYNRLRLN